MPKWICPGLQDSPEILHTAMRREKRYREESCGTSRWNSKPAPCGINCGVDLFFVRMVAFTGHLAQSV